MIRPLSTENVTGTPASGFPSASSTVAVNATAPVVVFPMLPVEIAVRVTVGAISSEAPPTTVTVLTATDE